MPSEIYSRLETLLARTGLNGPIAKAEAAAEAEALEEVLAFLQQIEASVFLPDAQGEGLRRWRRQVCPPAQNSSAASMLQKMQATHELFSLNTLQNLLPDSGFTIASFTNNTFTLSGITAENCVQLADEVATLCRYMPPFASYSLGGSGLSWQAFDALTHHFYDYDRAALRWQMIETIGG